MMYDTVNWRCADCTRLDPLPRMQFYQCCDSYGAVTDLASCSFSYNCGTSFLCTTLMVVQSNLSVCVCVRPDVKF